MAENDFSERAYLLGRLSETEAERLEADYFERDEVFAAILAAEDDLISEYLAGTLSPDDRHRFETRFLATLQGRHRMAIWVDLQRLIAAPAPFRQSFVRTGWLAAAAAVVLLVAVASLIGYFRLRDDVRALEAERASLTKEVSRLAEQATRPATPPPVEKPKPSERPLLFREPVIQTILLTPGLMRGGSGGNRLVVPHGTDVIRLLLPTEAADGVFAASVETVEGNEIAARRDLRSTPRGSGHAVALAVDSRLLRNDTYLVFLDEIHPEGKTERINEFTLRVIRR